MVELQQVTSAAPASQAAPAVPGQPTPAPTIGQTAPVPGAPTVGTDLSGYSASQLRRILSELRGQRQELADRRGTIGGQYETASGDNRVGIGERLRTLDANIVSYEREIARVGQTLAGRAGGESTQPPPRGPGGSGYMSEEDAAGMAFAFSFTTLVVAVFFTRRFMKRKYGGVMAGSRQPQNLNASNERLERIEQAVDTIAVEVERVSENQRFMTRLMTETQLGSTINDVRKSAELAKSAAEGP